MLPIYFRVLREGHAQQQGFARGEKRCAARDRVLPGPIVDLTITGIAWEWKIKIKLVSDQKLSHVSTLPFITPVASITPFVVEPLVITPRGYHAICKLAEVC